ncbi:MAG: hypothetical protein J6Y28_01295 [Acholeplasmatales bacterium]|nr:hypothetical protein [Acholeplasmatales bacterium]
MRYLYTLPVIAILFLIFVAVVTLLTQVVVTSFSVIMRPKKKKPLISHIFNISLILYYCVMCGIIASVQRHLTEGIIVFEYYTVIRYLAISVVITSILNVIFNREYANIGIAITSILLLPVFEEVFKKGYAYIYIFCLLYYLVYSIYLVLTLYEYNKKTINNLSIKEALDSLPIGICFANKKNRIIFNNKTMINILNYNGIESRIKIIDLWDEIKSKDFIFDDENTGLLKYNDETFMVVLDKANDLEYQIKATNISAEYEIIDEILQANQTLEEQEKSLKDYIVKIEEIERQKSLLRVKGRIHDVFAQRLSIIHQYLDNEDIQNISNEEIKKLLIDMTKDIKEENELNYDEIKNNIISSYALIGMKIDFVGDFNDKEGQNAILKIVREAATNALRHGGASELKVEYTNGIITITNNGVEPNVIKEGNGIKNMKFIAKENKLDLQIELKPYRIIIK